MTGSPVETALGFLPANSLIVKFLGFVDRFGDGTSLAPMHAPINTAGTRIDPATSQLQTTANNALQAIGSQLPASLGQKASAASLPVTLSTDGPFSTFASQFGSQTDVAATTDAGSFSFIALFKRALTYLDSVNAFVSALGTTADTAATSDTGTFSLTALTKRGVGFLDALAGTVSSGTLQIATRSNAPRFSVLGSLAAAYNGSNTVAQNVTAGAALVLAVDGMATNVLQVSGTWAGTGAVLASIDGGATYFAISVTPLGAAGGVAVSAITANGQWEFSAAGYTHVLFQMSSFTSGSANVLLAAANGGKIARVKAPASDPLPIVAPLSAAAPATSQLTVGTSVTPIAAAATGFVHREFRNNGTVAIYIGGASVTTTTGKTLFPGESFDFSASTAAWYAISGSAGQSCDLIQY